MKLQPEFQEFKTFSGWLSLHANTEDNHLNSFFNLSLFVSSRQKLLTSSWKNAGSVRLGWRKPESCLLLRSKLLWHKISTAAETKTVSRLMRLGLVTSVYHLFLSKKPLLFLPN
jgi:hypothetical protein